MMRIEEPHQANPKDSPLSSKPPMHTSTPVPTPWVNIQLACRRCLIRIEPIGQLLKYMHVVSFEASI